MRQNGIKFIGPPSHILAQMGDKLAAKATAIACGVPIIPGSTEPLKDADEAVEKAVSYGFPIILKAAAGGGGRGMRRCDNEEEVRPQFQLVKNEARKAFGNEDIFIEKFLVEPKHIEVQILADEHGNVDASGRAGLLPPAPLSEGGGVRPRLVRAPGDRARPCGPTR